MKYLLDNKFNFFSLSLLILILLYFPTFHAAPIWDDEEFIFANEAINGDSLITVWSIIKDFSWPTSALFYKLLYYIFEKNYFYYHWVNVILHFINGLLFFNFLRLQKVKYAHWCYLVFLFHPSMIISVSWMIQLKTILCALYALLSLNLLSLSEFSDLKKKYKLITASFLSYILSISSKSASVPLILPSLILTKKSKFKKLALIPLSFCSVYFTYRLLNSPLTHEGMDVAISVANMSSIKEFILTAIPQTINWYFWQSFIPLDSIPIRGPLPRQYAETCVGLFTICIFFIIIRKNIRALKFLFSGLLMLVPFIGLIPAPYMSSAWVSEQHLYLVLIFFIPGISLVMESIPNIRLRTSLQIISLVYLGFISFKSIDNYKDEFHFFKSSFNYNSNLPAGFQLLNYYVRDQQFDEALKHFYFMLTSIPPEQRPTTNLFWAQIIQLEPIILNHTKSE